MNSLASDLENTMKLCRRLYLFMTTRRMTPLWRLLAGCVAAVILLGPAELKSQGLLQYFGTVKGRYTATYPTLAGNVVQKADQVWRITPAGQSFPAWQ